jgi:glycosyltransferase involved in cell wall biosynthesis
METVKVSVIVPNYNHSNYLRKRLDSIFNQTFQDFEVILLDDASTDNSVEILNEYRRHQKVSHFIINEMNSGSTFKQWQKGIELAKGEFIWIAESDDWADEDFLKTLLIPNADIMTSKSYVITNNIQQISPDIIDTDLHINGINFISEYMICGNMLFNASAVLFRKSKINSKIFKIINSFRFLGDWIFWLDLLRNCKIYYCTTPLNYFNRHSNTVSHNAIKAGLFYFEGTQLIQYMKDNNILNNRDIWIKLWDCWISHYYNKYLIDKNTFSKMRFKITYLIFVKHFNSYLIFAFLKKICKNIKNNLYK